MPAIRDVAAHAGVSAATVSRVMNGSQAVSDELRRKVLEAADAVNYQSSTGRRTADRIALLHLYPQKNLSNPYEAACYDGMVAGMEVSDYDLVLTDLRRDRVAGETLLQFFTRKGVAGAIVRSTRGERPLVEELAASGFPFVLLGDHFTSGDTNITSCYSDSRAATREAISHLISLGHHQIAFASCDHHDGDHRDRFEAYQQVMIDNGYYSEDLVYLVPPHRMDGTQLARRILTSQVRPTALFVADPLTAIGILNEAYRLGVRVPEEFSLVGFDDTETRLLATPRMTAVVQDSRLMGQRAFELVVHKIEGKPVEQNAGQHECWLSIHDSTAPPPSNTSPVSPIATRRANGQALVRE